MRVVIRTDASLEIGTGHVMRCLTLAEELKKQGGNISFICRKHKGHLIEYIEGQGFKVFSLAEPEKDNQIECEATSPLTHAHWLGMTQYQDAEDCKSILIETQPEWVIVDHYALDNTWHRRLGKLYKKLMVIDDLADRKHDCNLLLDQTYGRKHSDYKHLVPSSCKMLLGSHYALLRPEFIQWRKKSLKRRVTPELHKLMVAMGGVDQNDVTSRILKKIGESNLQNDIEIIVVLGSVAPHANKVRSVAKNIPFKTKVLKGVRNMAEVMAYCDLAIGAAGATTWERCCLGVPTVQLVIAENQNTIAKLLVKDKAIKLVANINEIPEQLESAQVWMASISREAQKICDGSGVLKVVGKLIGLTGV